jgi:hypothetical protein
MIKFLSIAFYLILFDFIISQLFLLDILYKKKIDIFRSDIENRVSHKEYKYTFKENSEFIARYDYKYSLKDYLISTNNLGFRDKSIRTLKKNKDYSIVIGDSFVEGVALNYEDTLVAFLNKKLTKKQFNQFEFLNAGVSSYSPYIYRKKIESILKKNNWLNVKSVIILYDKSDVGDNTAYFNKPVEFSVEKKIFKNRKREKLLRDLKTFKFNSIFTEQTITGIFIREIIGSSFENLIRHIKFRVKSSNDDNISFFKVGKEKINSLYASDFHRLQSFFYSPLWEKEGKKSIDFAFEDFIRLKSFLDKKNIKLYVVVYPWPFDLLDDKVRKKYLNYLDQKFKENNINNLIIYDEFLKDNVVNNIFKFYIPKDVHFNKKGNEILGDKIFEKVF